MVVIFKGASIIVDSVEEAVEIVKRLTESGEVSVNPQFGPYIYTVPPVYPTYPTDYWHVTCSSDTNSKSVK